MNSPPLETGFILNALHHSALHDPVPISQPPSWAFMVHCVCRAGFVKIIAFYVHVLSSSSPLEQGRQFKCKGINCWIEYSDQTQKPNKNIRSMSSRMVRNGGSTLREVSCALTIPCKNTKWGDENSGLGCFLSFQGLQTCSNLITTEFYLPIKQNHTQKCKNLGKSWEMQKL